MATCFAVALENFFCTAKVSDNALDEHFYGGQTPVLQNKMVFLTLERIKCLKDQSNYCEQELWLTSSDFAPTSHICWS